MVYQLKRDCARHGNLKNEHALALAGYGLNLFDLACTLYALRGGAMELNPLMQSVPVMIAYKIIIVGGLLWWLSRRPERIARTGLRLCTAVYAGLAGYHLYFIL